MAPMETGGAEDRLRDLKSVTDSSLSYLPLEALLDELLARLVEILDARLRLAHLRGGEHGFGR
jgi:hypothetical protein